MKEYANRQKKKGKRFHFFRCSFLVTVYILSFWPLIYLNKFVGFIQYNPAKSDSQGTEKIGLT